MHYYIISFHVTIDGKNMGTGLVGHVSPASDYKPDLLIGRIIKQYRKNYPGSKVVNIKTTEVKEVSQNQYNDESEKLMEIS